jgi:hypothetical protein
LSFVNLSDVERVVIVSNSQTAEGGDRCARSPSAEDRLERIAEVAEHLV